MEDNVKLSLGIDIGGTKLAIALVDEFGKVKKVKRILPDFFEAS
jgi:predicted NBD/HSP70 family sugar kinase